MIADLRLWSKRPVPSAEVLDGKLIRLQRLDLAKHSEDLWNNVNNRTAIDDSNWRYYPYGPFDDKQALEECLKEVIHDEDAVPYAVVSKSDGKAQGVLAYRSVEPQFGTLEASEFVDSGPDIASMAADLAASAGQDLVLVLAMGLKKVPSPVSHVGPKSRVSRNFFGVGSLW